MDYLLDTHVLLWSIFNSNKLSGKAQQILLDRGNRKFISVSSVWEIAIKNRIGKLPLPNGLSDIFTEIELNGFGYMGIGLQHMRIQGRKKDKRAKKTVECKYANRHPANPTILRHLSDI